ncbi:unnamed protein product [Rangifer tarandus platyrhynchus]|uniref:Uncharacterized protein n=2 Tax=Rangifer tarandus platyrhynchus TaxID=3082113 RepID=A0ABN8Z3J5_RANTA|nr:unnamed protein product [Rangifer tarandus platyrhynchus]
MEHLDSPAQLWECNHPTNGKLVEPSKASNSTPGDFLKRNEHCVYQKTYTRVFIAVLLTAQHGSNPKSTSGRMDKHSVVLLCNRILPQTSAATCITRTEPRGLMLNERSQTQEHTLHDPIL